MSSEIGTHVCCNEVHVVYSLFLSGFTFLYMNMYVYMY